MSSSTAKTADSLVFTSVLGILILGVGYFILTSLRTGRLRNCEVLENRERQRRMEPHIPRPSRGTQVMMDWKRDDAQGVFCAQCGKEVRAINKMLHVLAVAVYLATPATALALPQITTGPPGTYPQPFAQNTTLGFFSGKSFDAGTKMGSVSADTITDLDGCGIRTGEGVIKSMYCTPMTHSTISIGQVAGGICTFTLFSGSKSCEVVGGGQRRQMPIPNGDEETCISTGVLDGGRFQKASGIWACG
ncbi:hypothetical protein CERZMDRAFT_106208 [Cercospora zeae-maydis SCOH1-5]|uniref:Uncharacterized protein n=1 Tax=Cercospora zeae-maydis SCOH1-5 TaxID=717836 RepID=A0A6A6FEQ6_9PEZI|nr:hypothetical protein CERZMDRAFT_106208 [Cercospora zeae-maydis SCOH1-5]